MQHIGNIDCLSPQIQKGDTDFAANMLSPVFPAYHLDISAHVKA
jgi:hypothetical protein